MVAHSFDLNSFLYLKVPKQQMTNFWFQGILGVKIHLSTIYIPLKYILILQYTLKYLPNTLQYLFHTFEKYYNTITII
jgi:hypothetical protein